MAKKQSRSFFSPISHAFKKFHLTIFFVCIVAGLAGAVLLVNSILTEKAPDDNYVSPISPGTIDQATLERLQTMHTSNRPGPAPESSGRSNPFAE